mgnify:CR=1 FL=1
MTWRRIDWSDDAGQVGGIEAIPFGLLIFVIGTLLVAFLTPPLAEQVVKVRVDDHVAVERDLDLASVDDDLLRVPLAGGAEVAALGGDDVHVFEQVLADVGAPELATR